jgi:zinc protease
VSGEGGQEASLTTEYADYRKVGTLMFPFKITQTVGEQEFTMDMTEIKVNEAVTEADFKQ